MDLEEKRKKRREASKRWYYAHLERARQIAREYTETHKKQKAVYKRRYRKRASELRREHRKQMRLSLLIRYGGNPPKCACCGESALNFLSLDHINGGGSHQRKTMWDGRGGDIFYKWLFHNNFPEGFQVLCMNCNWGRYRNDGICPHIQA